MRSAILMSAALAVLLTACTSQSNRSSTPETAATAQNAVLRNPTDFPLIAGATVLDVKPFSQTVSADSTKTSGLTAQGSGTYSGNELLAASSDSTAHVTAWLDSVERNPPSGYAYQPAASSSRTVTSFANKYGVHYAVFKNVEPGKRRAVVIVVMDPLLVRSKLGVALDLVDKYRGLPDYLRKPIDDQLKSKVGISATDATDPSSPLGMTIAAAREMQTRDERAIVLLDATKH